MFRRPLPNGSSRSCFDRLSNRLTKILTEARKLRTTWDWTEIGRLSRPIIQNRGIPLRAGERRRRGLSHVRFARYMASDSELTN